MLNKMFESADLHDLDKIAVGPGCYRWDLPTANGTRHWVVEIEAGATWPHIDRHGAGGESVFVLEGEVIEGDERFGPGTFLQFAPFSEHQPRSESGVKLFGYNAGS